MKKPDTIKKDKEMEEFDSEMKALKMKAEQNKRDTKKLELDFQKQDSLREKNNKSNKNEISSIGIDFIKSSLTKLKNDEFSKDLKKGMKINKNMNVKKKTDTYEDLKKD